MPISDPSAATKGTSGIPTTSNIPTSTLESSLSPAYTSTHTSETETTPLPQQTTTLQTSKTASAKVPSTLSLILTSKSTDLSATLTSLASSLSTETATTNSPSTSTQPMSAKTTQSATASSSSGSYIKEYFNFTMNKHVTQLNIGDHNKIRVMSPGFKKGKNYPIGIEMELVILNPHSHVSNSLYCSILTHTDVRYHLYSDLLY